jgi:hypothetical protein
MGDHLRVPRLLPREKSYMCIVLARLFQQNNKGKSAWQQTTYIYSLNLKRNWNNKMGCLAFTGILRNPGEIRH